MHHVPTPSGGIREVLDVHDCPKCGQPFARGQMTKGWLACGCAGGGHGREGHRTVRCFREVDGQRCNGLAYDPPHRGQYGPTGDYGGQTMHPG